MLSDDFDLFDIEQEVVFDSSFPRNVGSQGPASIFDAIKQVSGQNYLAHSYRD